MMASTTAARGDHVGAGPDREAQELETTDGEDLSLVDA